VIGRRDFATSALALAATPLGAWAQQRVPRIGYVTYLGPGDFRSEAVLEGLRELGYENGKTINIEFFYATSIAAIAEAVAKCVASKPDLIVAVNSPTALAAKAATSSIPIVFVGVADPIAIGLVEGLSRPSGNATGPSNMASDTAAKRLQILREIAPGLSLVGAVFNPENLAGQASLSEIERAGLALGVEVRKVEARATDDFDGKFAALVRDGLSGLILVQDSTLTNVAPRIAAAALKHRLPTVYDFSVLPESGGLISYGPSQRANFRRAAYYIDRILKGAKPPDLPVEQPREFELIINKKTATALGLTIPEHLLVFATEVIE
jgi:putative tryptophan/tyrosine transport system substrate-binding protein